MRLLFKRPRVFDRYTERARRVIFFAMHDALERGAKDVSPEDIVLGLARDQHSDECPFRFVHERRHDLAASVQLPWIKASTKWSPVDPRVRPGLAGNTKRLLNFARQEADDTKLFWIDTDHLQVAALLIGGRAATALNAIGYTLESTRQFGREARERWPPKKPRLKDRLGRLTVGGWIAVGTLTGLLIVNLYNLLRFR